MLTEPAAPPAPSTAAFDFELPPELIAQVPAARRDGARLLVLGRRAGGLDHRAVSDLPGLLRPGDLLVFNDARVRPARLFGRIDSGGAVELLVVRARAGGVWECLGRPSRRLRPGMAVALPDGSRATVRERLAPGRYALAFSAGDVEGLLERHGELPLPPYIRRPDGPLPSDAERYQTVFARRPGAVAAPTAGLHFTPALLAALAGRGIDRAFVTLDVGPATFLPLRQAADGLDGEWAEVPAATVDAIARTRAAGGRIVAVGTTTTRALESAARRPGGLQPGGFWADAFIRPGFRFAVADALLTNFHLPRSTLLMLVAAFAGQAPVLAAYAEAVRARYRFYSYGDAMLIA
ncbi:tRNA preQ1(34) S-adenosylmethionine ribosyltransferase-isomerase QueA [bacterium]|nr:tRNA preQ1(34) S-adenosylmethionine ribosyltransferase-isomerase QueA [bacterium]